MKIWFDITNFPHVHFFAPIIEHFDKKHEIIVTARDFSETLSLLDSYGIKYTSMGNHKGKSKVKKVTGLIRRVFSMIKDLPEFDISFGIGGQNTTPVCAIRRKPAVVFTDNDTSYKWHSYKLGSYFVFPTYFNYQNVMKKYKVKRNQIILYNGFKEDVYMANYTPNSSFLDEIPFKDFITIKQLAKIFSNILKKEIIGIYNVSISKKIFIKELISWLNIYNPNKKQFLEKEVTKNYIKSQSFTLNNDKLCRKIKYKPNKNELKNFCKEISKHIHS